MTDNDIDIDYTELSLMQRRRKVVELFMRLEV